MYLVLPSPDAALNLIMFYYIFYTVNYWFFISIRSGQAFYMFLFKFFFQLEQKHTPFLENYDLDSQNHPSLFNCLSKNKKN